MKSRLIHLVLASVFCSLSSVSKSQSVISTSGGNGQGTGGSISYTVGQIGFVTSSGSNGSIEAGVQRAFEVSVVSSIRKGNKIELEMRAFPNPTHGVLSLVVKNYKRNSFIYQLFDQSGKLMEQKNITSELTGIDMSTKIPGSYILTVTHKEQGIKSFNIIKN